MDPEKIFCVSIMPCIAKKDECTWDGGKDVDAVLTTREVERMFKAFFIKPEELGEDEFDDPLGSGTGAGVIFGATGGVMEAALRSAYFLVTGKNRRQMHSSPCVVWTAGKKRSLILRERISVWRFQRAWQRTPPDECHQKERSALRFCGNHVLSGRLYQWRRTAIQRRCLRR